MGYFKNATPEGTEQLFVVLACVHNFSSLEVATSAELVFKKQTLISIILATIPFPNQLGSRGLCGDWSLS